MIILVKVRPFFQVQFTLTINKASNITIIAKNNGTSSTVTTKITQRTTTIFQTALNIVDFVLASFLNKGTTENTIIHITPIQAYIFNYIFPFAYSFLPLHMKPVLYTPKNHKMLCSCLIFILYSKLIILI